MRRCQASFRSMKNWMTGSALPSGSGRKSLPRLLLDVAAVEGRLYTVQHAGDLRFQHARAIDMLTPDDEFFGDELVPLQEAALDQHRAGQSELVSQ